MIKDAQGRKWLMRFSIARAGSEPRATTTTGNLRARDCFESSRWGRCPRGNSE